MRIAFASKKPMKYTVETPLLKPLGGSESAICYLAVALARRGHQVILFSDIEKEEIIKGVKHIKWENLNKKNLSGLDVLIIQNTPVMNLDLKKLLPKKTKLIFWSQHAANQPAVGELKNEKVVSMYDLIVLISIWQNEDYLNIFPIPRNKTAIIRNAISPAFENLFGKTENVIESKLQSPVFAYTSTPFRGLDLLLNMFPKIKKEIPNCTLKIFGGMETYQDSSGGFRPLYEMARSMDGVQVVGAVSQTELAKELKKVTALTYPNTFAETGCTSILEAMAAGLLVVSSDFAAIPETSMGFAQLIPLTGSVDEYTNKFINALKVGLQHPERSEILKRQVDFVNGTSTWEDRAREWEAWILKL